MTTRTITRQLISIVLIFGTTARAAEGSSLSASAAFDKYVRQSEARMTNRIDDDVAFASKVANKQTQQYEELKQGKILIEPVQGEHNLPGGLIHHWVGTVLFAGATLQQTVSLLQNYEKYPEIYRPTVVSSKLLGRDRDNFKVFLRLKQTHVLTAVFNTEYEIHYTYFGEKGALVRSYSTRIAEIEEPGGSAEREKPLGADSGFLWRLNTYWTLRQLPEGTLAECESISLSRAIPPGLGWLIAPFVESIPRESLRFTLEATRKALEPK